MTPFIETGLSEKEFTKKRALMPFLKRIFRCSLKYKKWVIRLIVSAAFVSVLSAGFPLIWLNYIDNFISPEVARLKQNSLQPVFTEAVWRQFGIFTLIYLFVIIIQSLGIGVFNYYSGKIKEYVIFDLRTDMFTKLQRLPYAFYDKSATGWLLVRMTADVDKVSEIISNGFVTLISGMMMMVACLIAMFFYSWKLALVVLMVMPLLVISSVKIRMLMLSYARKARRLYSIMAAFLTENINGIEVNKATVQEDTAAVNFQNLTGQLRHSAYTAAYYSAFYNPVIIVVGALATAAVIFMGGKMLFASEISIGMLAAFFAYSRSVFDPILDLTRYYAATQDSLSAGERIFSLIDEPVTLADKTEAVVTEKLRGNIVFEKVDFHYLANKSIIENLNLEIKAGESIALVGPTGEGKTTLLNLICRFYEPTNGTIKIDGKDYRNLTLQSYRRRLGIILQTAYLFSGTVRDNLRYGKADATDAEIQEALKSIGAEEFVTRLDDEVGEEGNHLSAGEKQLLSLTRAMLKNPDILLMDEATSSIDTLAEKKIQQGILQLTTGRTSIIIAHRLSTIKHCDRILVVYQGKIIEDGNHTQLLEKQGFYYNLYMRQVREKSLVEE